MHTTSIIVSAPLLFLITLISVSTGQDDYAVVETEGELFISNKLLLLCILS